MRTFTLVSIALIAGLVIGGVLVGLASYLVSIDKSDHSTLTNLATQVQLLTAALPLLDPLCDNDNLTCTHGVSTLINGTRVCRLDNAPIGAACTSACYVNGTNTTCDGAQGCGNADPTTCKGYCTVTGTTPILGEGSECLGKFTFWPFYQPDVVGESSALYFQWLLYTNYTPSCAALGGCTWISTQFQLQVQNNTYLWLVNLPPLGMDCKAFSNSTNNECINAVSIPLGTTTATTIFRNLWNTYAGIPEFWDQFYFEGNICMYQYKCGFQNTSAYSDPAFLLAPTKRSAEAAATASLHSQVVQHVVDDFQQNPDKARRVLQPQIEAQLAALTKRRSLAIGS